MTKGRIILDVMMPSVLVICIAYMESMLCKTPPWVEILTWVFLTIVSLTFVRKMSYLDGCSEKFGIDDMLYTIEFITLSAVGATGVIMIALSIIDLIL